MESCLYTTVQISEL